MKDTLSDITHSRKFVHWVNTLPFSECLLVENICELRSGDILQQIVQVISPQHQILSYDLIESQSSDTLGIERIQSVLNQLARQSSTDTEALRVLNDSACALRVYEGDDDTIIEVLKIVQRLWLLHTHTFAPSEGARVQYSINQEALATHQYLTKRPELLISASKSTKLQKRDIFKKCAANGNADANGAFEPMKRLIENNTSAHDLFQRNYHPKSASNRIAQAPSIEKLAVETCHWLRSLRLFHAGDLKEIDISWLKSPIYFNDGVLLCELVATVLKRFGGMQKMPKIDICNSDTVCPNSIKMTLHGSFQCPHTLGQKKKNLRLAFQLLIQEQLFTLNPFLKSVDDIWKCFFPKCIVEVATQFELRSSQFQPRFDAIAISAGCIWHLLNHIRRNVIEREHALSRKRIYEKDPRSEA
uniref:AlNc14C90G5658 protein n=1 Tax=Albugo laibachii Nc14 TaxID=890382 RepID=F0WGC7_9STRA|nr:AlNc14C90G5658 [Albugo laibachii Nc14]|eukprot:CCA20287.1 AlNc14C90G5658 [Albugo laibachii Nc14]